MEPALKQRLIGAMVLVALAVIFLPMLIKGPAPESGASDVPLKLPEAPQGEYETRELPLVTPGAAPNSGVVGMDARDADDGDALPMVDTTVADNEMMPAATAGGDYAVSFGSYATAADAERVVAALRKSQLPGYQETTAAERGRTLYRVRIGPYATQADAEAARLRAGHVRDDVGAKVVVLNDDAAEPAAPTSTASVSQPVATQTPSVSAPQPLPESKPAASKPLAAAKPVKPAETKVAAPVPAPQTRPAAAGTGFAVQLGAFGNVAEANKLRDRARAAGFSAFVESVRTDTGSLNRVRVGPVSTRADAEQMKTQVAAKLGIKDAIVKSHP